MSKLKVELTSEYQTKDGGYVYHYDVGNWLMELVQAETYDHEIADAKHAIEAHKAWLKYLKKLNKKNPRH